MGRRLVLSALRGDAAFDTADATLVSGNELTTKRTIANGRHLDVANGGVMPTSGLQCFLQLGFLLGRQACAQDLATESRHCGQHLISCDLADQHAERRLAWP